MELIARNTPLAPRPFLAAAEMHYWYFMKASKDFSAWEDYRKVEYYYARHWEALLMAAQLGQL